MYVPGKASFILGGQWGSEGKGAAAAWLAVSMSKSDQHFDIVTTNAGAQAGHTSVHDGVKRVVYHLPTYPLIARACGAPPMLSYLNAGSIIDPVKLLEEIEEHNLSPIMLGIHPNAAIITPDCTEAEGRDSSAQTKIASTRKGVGEALARKVLRSGMIAAEHPKLKPFVVRWNLNHTMTNLNKAVLVEVPQGIGLSLNGPFYPYCTSRDCTVASAMSDAGIHPSLLGQVMVILRTYPIRVGNITAAGDAGMLGFSGPHYDDQKEVTWEEVGVKAEITTVTKRVRRVFTFSRQQLRDTLDIARPDVIYLTFCDYCTPERNRSLVTEIKRAAKVLGLDPKIRMQYGPSTDDVYNEVQEKAA